MTAQIIDINAWRLALCGVQPANPTTRTAYVNRMCPTCEGWGALRLGNDPMNLHRRRLVPVHPDTRGCMSCEVCGGAGRLFSEVEVEA